MICNTCMFDCIQSCKYFYNEEITDLLCIFVSLPNDILSDIYHYIYHYEGHCVTYRKKMNVICSPCFQMDYYKTLYNKQLNFFDMCINDNYTKKVKEYFNKKYIPKTYNICS